MQAPGLFSRPLVPHSHLSVFVFGVEDYGSFWETTPRNVFVFSAIWFDSGYVFASVFVAVLVPQVALIADHGGLSVWFRW